MKYVKALKCGHWTTDKYCQRHGIKVTQRPKTVSEGGRLMKDGMPDKHYLQLEADVLCAKCMPKGKDELDSLKAKRMIYRERKKLRDELEQTCPICSRIVRPRIDSQAFNTCFAGLMPKPEAKKLILKAHIRHSHTDYDATRLDEYEKYRGMGFSWEEAHAEARNIARREIKK